MGVVPSFGFGRIVSLHGSRRRVRSPSCSPHRARARGKRGAPFPWTPQQPPWPTILPSTTRRDRRGRVPQNGREHRWETILPPPPPQTPSGTRSDPEPVAGPVPPARPICLSPPPPRGPLPRPPAVG